MIAPFIFLCIVGSSWGQVKPPLTGVFNHLRNQHPEMEVLGPTSKSFGNSSSTNKLEAQLFAKQQKHNKFQQQSKITQHPEQLKTIPYPRPQQHKTFQHPHRHFSSQQPKQSLYQKDINHFSNQQQANHIPYHQQPQHKPYPQKTHHILNPQRLNHIPNPQPINHIPYPQRPDPVPLQPQHNLYPQQRKPNPHPQQQLSLFSKQLRKNHFHHNFGYQQFEAPNKIQPKQKPPTPSQIIIGMPGAATNEIVITNDAAGKVLKTMTRTQRKYFVNNALIAHMTKIGKWPPSKSIQKSSSHNSMIRDTHSANEMNQGISADGLNRISPSTNGFTQSKPSSDGLNQRTPLADLLNQGTPTTNGFRQGIPSTDGLNQSIPSSNRLSQGTPSADWFSNGTPSTDVLKQGTPPSSEMRKGTPSTNGNIFEIHSMNNANISPSSINKDTSAIGIKLDTSFKHVLEHTQPYTNRMKQYKPSLSGMNQNDVSVNQDSSSLTATEHFPHSAHGLSKGSSSTDGINVDRPSANGMKQGAALDDSATSKPSLNNQDTFSGKPMNQGKHSDNSQNQRTIIDNSMNQWTPDGKNQGHTGMPHGTPSAPNMKQEARRQMTVKEMDQYSTFMKKYNTGGVPLKLDGSQSLTGLTSLNRFPTQTSHISPSVITFNTGGIPLKNGKELGQF